MWGKLEKCFKLNKMASVFKALDDISHCLVHAERICQSWLIIPCKSATDDAEQKRELSSANKRVKLSSDSAMSLTYIKNSRGPRTEPWGTPASTGFNVEEQDLITTRCDLLLK